jgi:phosphate transport system substrate-binding protein
VSSLRFVALAGAVVLTLAVALAACGSDSVPLSGSIHVDGSKTVAPLTQAMARRFVAEHPNVHVTVGTSAAGAGPGEIPVVNDAVVLMVNPANPVRCLTTAQLRQIWHGNSEVTERWSQVDDLDPPYDGDLNAWGTGTDTETFAFFTEAVNGNEGETRDYNNSLHREADPVAAIAGSVTFFGYAQYRWYAARPRTVKAIAVDSGEGCVAPTPETIADGTFRPLSRRLSISAPAADLARPATKAFLQFYLDNVQDVAEELRFVPLTDEQSAESRARLDSLIAGASRPS